MRQGTTDTTERPRIRRRRLKATVAQYTRTEIDQMLDRAIEKFKISQGEARLQAREEMNEVLGLWANGQRYTMEELNERIRKAKEYFDAGGKGIPHEQAMNELDEFVDLLCS